jgi:glycosyltransferase involved in cell wall biosynthesis
MRIHLLALPNAQTTREYSLCGFTQATIRFARIVKELGHELILYASEENEAPCDELVTCIRKAEIAEFLHKRQGEYQRANMHHMSPLFRAFNIRAGIELAARKDPGDLLCLIGGGAQRDVADAHPDLVPVEYSIGYQSSWAKWRVFQSYTHMHATYGQQGIMRGRATDTVIPCFFDAAELPFCDQPEDYWVFLGRFDPLKGVGAACQIATAAGVKLKIIGHGDASRITGGHEYLGALDMWERNKVISKARGMICPTLYVEPFGCASPEAQMCGTPVVSVDWGGFVETVEQGKTGFRCTHLHEFVAAIGRIGEINRQYVYDRAMGLFSMGVSREKYRKYFARMELLRTDAAQILTQEEGPTLLEVEQRIRREGMPVASERRDKEGPSVNEIRGRLELLTHAPGPELAGVMED